MKRIPSACTARRALASAPSSACSIAWISCVGTFSKSLGGVGGFCVSRHPDFELLRLGSRPYIFTASPPPPVIAAARAALQRLLRGDDLRAQLWKNIERFYAAVTRLGYRIGSKDPGPVTALVFNEREHAIAHWQGLLDAGIYTNLMVPPSTPAGLNIVRISLSAAHSDAQISRMIEAFEQLRRPPAARCVDPAGVCSAAGARDTRASHPAR